MVQQKEQTLFQSQAKNQRIPYTDTFNFEKMFQW